MNIIAIIQARLKNQDGLGVAISEESHQGYRPAKRDQCFLDLKFPSQMFLKISLENLTFSKIKIILDR
jgi:hypothetical protein